MVEADEDFLFPTCHKQQEIKKQKERPERTVPHSYFSDSERETKTSRDKGG